MLSTITINLCLHWVWKPEVHWNVIPIMIIRSKTLKCFYMRLWKTYRKLERIIFRIYRKCTKRWVNNYLQIISFHEQLQFNKPHNKKKINVPQAERRLSPEYQSRYERALNCTTKTHRCLHAVHAYTGIPCAAYSKSVR